MSIVNNTAPLLMINHKAFYLHVFLIYVAEHKKHTFLSFHGQARIGARLDDKMFYVM